MALHSQNATALAPCLNTFRTIDGNMEYMTHRALHAVLTTLFQREATEAERTQQLEGVWARVGISDDSFLSPADFMAVLLALVAEEDDGEDKSVPVIHTAPEALQLFAALAEENRTGADAGRNSPCINDHQLRDLLLLPTRGGCRFHEAQVDDLLAALALTNRRDIGFEEFQWFVTRPLATSS